ncbi:hypothetical protein H5410_061811 [Solanum commersonii]|uniref:Uncharacterized protein n=1 Tax=Solanum commersonii TaxID=4109 RepID=A0A9J5W8X7_SOLCO|nr:hypothetical protein H5410_061811 [Solanum commersonii]
MPQRASLYEWFENTTIYIANAPLNLCATHVHSQCNAVPSRRSRAVGMRVFIAENGFITYNYGLPSSRILHTGSEQPISSTDVTGDLAFKSRTGVRRKGKKVMRTN